MDDEVLMHKLFQDFLKKNEYYKDSLDIVLEDYYAIFKAGYLAGEKVGYDEGYDIGTDHGYDTACYNHNVYESEY